ncbi:MAG: NAD(P)-dependent oxidoreductase [Chitinophagaceae bacterium]
MSLALITGASKGIGKAIAFQLAAKGNNLLLVARNEQLLQSVAEEIKKVYPIAVDYFAIDLSQQGAAKKIFDWCQQKRYTVSILVNNAGYGLSGKFETYSLTDHLQMMQVNMNAVVELTHLFLPQLKRQPQAYILNIASSAAYQAVPYLSIYAASKAFVLQFSRGLNYELKNTPVSVTCISPGSTDTDFASRANVGDKGLKAAKKVNMTPEEVASIAVNAMYTKKSEVITGLINKLGAFFVWLLPKRLVENTAAKIYE